MTSCSANKRAELGFIHSAFTSEPVATLIRASESGLRPTKAHLRTESNFTINVLHLRSQKIHSTHSHVLVRRGSET